MNAPAVRATGWLAPTGVAERTVVLLHPRNRRAARHLHTAGAELLRHLSGRLDGDTLNLRVGGHVVADLRLDGRMADVVREHGSVIVLIGAGPLIGTPTVEVLQRYGTSIGIITRGHLSVVLQ